MIAAAGGIKAVLRAMRNIKVADVKAEGSWLRVSGRRSVPIGPRGVREEHPADDVDAAHVDAHNQVCRFVVAALMRTRD